MREAQRPFTLMFCDNLQSNGDAARRALLAFVELRDRNTHGGQRRSGGELRNWIETNVAFPNSMVDRITPRTIEADRDFIADTSACAPNSGSDGALSAVGTGGQVLYRASRVGACRRDDDRRCGPV